MSESPLAELRERMKAVYDSGDASPLLAPEVVTAVAELPHDDPDCESEALFLVGLFHWYRGQVLPMDESGRELETALVLFARILDRRRNDLPEAVATALSGDAATSARDDADADDAAIWNRLGAALLLRGRQTGSVVVMTQGLALLRGAVARTREDNPQHATHLSNLAIGLRYRSDRTGRVDDLDEAVTAASAAVQRTAHDDGSVDQRLMALGNALSTRFERTGKIADLDAAIDACGAAIAATPGGDTSRGARLATLGAALRTRYERTGAVADLDAALEACQAGVAALPEDHPDRAVCLSNLSITLQTRFERSADAADIDAAIVAGRQALAALPEDHPDTAACRGNLGNALQVRADATGSTQDLDEAVDIGYAAVAAVPDDHPWHPAGLSNLGVALHTRYRRRGDKQDLDAAIEAARAAVGTTPDGHPDRAARSTNLGTALLTRFEHTNATEDLNCAVQASRAALGATPDDHPNKAACRSNLGNVLKVQFDRFGSIENLDEAIDLGRAAVRSIPDDHPDRRIYLSNLGNSLQVRFERSGALADLDQAVEACQEAADATPQDHADRLGYLCNLGTALVTRFERTQNLNDLDVAIDTDREAAELATPNPSYQAVCLSNLGLALRHRFQATGHASNLDEAVVVGGAAAELLPAHHPTRAMCLSNLGNTLSDRFEHNGDRTDIDASIEVGIAAVDETSEVHPSRSSYLINLGNSLFARHETTAMGEDLSAAAKHWRAAAELIVAPPWHRCVAACQWGFAAARTADWSTAVDAYALAVELLHQVVDRSLHRNDQEFQLERFNTLASDAAAAALHRADVVYRTGETAAIALLERGRSVLLTQTLQSRTDLERLHDRKADLADRLIAIDGELDRAPEERLDPDADPGVGKDYEHRRALVAERKKLVANIRSLKGFTDFQLPPTTAQLMSAAEHGPVVAVNVSEHRCDALIVSAQDIKTIPLPRLTAEAAYEQSQRLRSATDMRKAGTRNEVQAVLAWLWDAVADPILEALELIETPSSNAPWPRMWWMPTGLLTFMPLHAAGHPGEPSVLDRVISSYTPTIGALAQARTRPPMRCPDANTLVVAVGHTKLTGYPDLPNAAVEATDVAAIVASERVMLDHAATRSQVMKALCGGSHAHFACHATHDFNDPSGSRLVLHDGCLTVLDISRQRLANVELAYLSACATARGGVKLADEALHISSAFHLAGFTHVVGSLWQVPDDIAHGLATQVYKDLTKDRATPDIARAVHEATRRHRDSAPGANPRLWASLVHIGP
ncbi:MAG: CHAT domain-containing protein [Pseudonocardiaceae bacterium]